MPFVELARNPSLCALEGRLLMIALHDVCFPLEGGGAGCTDGQPS